jgi:hypothetical protein
VEDGRGVRSHFDLCVEAGAENGALFVSEISKSLPIDQRQRHILEGVCPYACVISAIGVVSCAGGLVIERTLLPSAEACCYRVPGVMFRITPRCMSADVQENMQAYISGSFLKPVCDKRRA